VSRRTVKPPPPTRGPAKGVERCFHITKPQDEWLASESDRLGISKNELVRRIFDERRTIAPSAPMSRPSDV